MEIVINDTNILIDLFNAGLLGYCRQLDIEFRTLDVIISESLAWETEVWIADMPDHMIHLNGDKFMGPRNK